MLKQVYDSGAMMYENFKSRFTTHHTKDYSIVLNNIFCLLNKKFEDDYEEKKLIDPDTSVNLLLDIIKRNKFDNGISIDFFEFF